MLMFDIDAFHTDDVNACALCFRSIMRMRLFDVACVERILFCVGSPVRFCHFVCNFAVIGIAFLVFLHICDH